MELGLSIAIYLSLSLLILVLICMLTKYFHYKMKNSLEEVVGSQMLSEELRSHSTLDDDEQYNDYASREQRKQAAKALIFGGKSYEIQLEDVQKIPLVTSRNPYLMKNLSKEDIPLNQETYLSKSSLKAIKFQQMSSAKFANNRLNIVKQQQQMQVYDLISKLIGYEQNQITILEMNVKTIKKDERNNIIESKKMQKSILDLKEEGEWQFDDYLEAFRFTKGEYGGYKYINRVQVNNLAINEEYELKSLKLSQSTEWIQLDQFKKMSQSINQI